MVGYLWLNSGSIFLLNLIIINYLSGQSLLPTELQYSDGFAQLASHLLLEVNYESGIFSQYW